jgi:hypothetical protein
MIVSSNFMITRSATPASRKGGGAGPTADMSRTRAPGFGPLVASRPAS